MSKQSRISDEEIETFKDYILPKFRQLYFFGYSLEQVNERQLFRRLLSMTERMLGFCMESSAINMIALKDVLKSRLVRGKSSEGGWHSWVEVDFDCFTLAIDPCWMYSNLGEPNMYCMERNRYYAITGLSPLRVYTYDEFWQYDLSRELFYGLSHARRSTLSSCVVSAYRPIATYEGGDQFSTQFNHLAGDKKRQHQFVARLIREGIIPRYPKKTVKTLMDDMSLGYYFRQPETLEPAE